MLPTRRFHALLFSTFLGLLAVSGCGGKKGVALSGTMVLPPNVKLAEDDTVAIGFVPEDKASEGGPGIFSPGDNSFVVKGATGKGLAPGKYKVTVAIQPYPGKQDSARREAQLAPLNTAYDSAHTKLAYEVTPGSSGPITIDLGKGTVTKN